MNRNKYMYNVQDVMGILDCSVDHAYKVIKKLNVELQKEGYMTEAGKVPAPYFAKKFYGYEAS